MTDRDAEPTAHATVLDRLLVLAAARFGLARQDLSGEKNIFDALGIDSVQAMEWLFELEDAFGVEIEDYELRSVSDFASLAELIEKRR
jgi:acyl carrier protein